MPAHGLVTLSRTDNLQISGEAEMDYNAVIQNTGMFGTNLSSSAVVTIPADDIYTIHLHGFITGTSQINSSIEINDVESLITNLWWAPMQGGSSYSVLHATFAVALNQGDKVRHILRGTSGVRYLTQTNTMTVMH